MSNNPFLSVVALLLVAPASNADIVVSTSTLYQHVNAFGYTQTGNATDITSYHETFYRDIPFSPANLATSATNTFNYTQNLNTGLFTGAYSFDLRGSQSAQAQMAFTLYLDLTQAYDYEITVTAPANQAPSFWLDANGQVIPSFDAFGPKRVSISGNGSGAPSIYSGGTYGAWNFYQAGTIQAHPNPGVPEIFISLFFNGCNPAAGCSNQALQGSGEFQIQLAPVPLPAAAWLLLSGLGGLGVFARRRQHTA